MHLENTSLAQYRSGFMAFAVAATCATSTAFGGETFGRRAGNEQQRVQTVLNSSSARFGKSDYEVYFVGNDKYKFDFVTRDTTDRERVIAELRSWRNLGSDWDGEGAKPPILSTLDSARAFLCIMQRDAICPEPVLHPSGRAGLYWREKNFYAELEFYPNGSIAYYIERDNDRHKGFVEFDLYQIPSVFNTLLPI